MYFNFLKASSVLFTLQNQMCEHDALSVSLIQIFLILYFCVKIVSSYVQHD